MVIRVLLRSCGIFVQNAKPLQTRSVPLSTLLTKLCRTWNTANAQSLVNSSRIDETLVFPISIYKLKLLIDVFESTREREKKKKRKNRTG